MDRLGVSADGTIEAEAASAPQRRRSAALLVGMIALAAVGVLSRVRGPGVVPAPCPAPALRDGVLTCDGAGAPVGARAWLVGHKLDVNLASVSELEQISGVGPSLARRIVEARAQRGRFRSLEELDEVGGVGPKTLAKLAEFLEVQ